MAIPQFTVTGNLGEILGDSTASVLDVTYPTTLRVVFTTNFDNVHDVITYGGNLYKVDEPIYAGIESDGDLVHATMVAGVLTADVDPIILVARNGINNDMQYKFSLQEPAAGNDPWGYTYWRELTSWWFDAGYGGATIDLSVVAPVIGTDRKRGPAANIVSGYFDGNDDLILVNADGSATTPIAIPAGAITFVDNGDGTVQVG